MCSWHHSCWHTLCQAVSEVLFLIEEIRGQKVMLLFISFYSSLFVSVTSFVSVKIKFMKRSPLSCNALQVVDTFHFSHSVAEMLIVSFLRNLYGFVLYVSLCFLVKQRLSKGT